MHTLIKQGISLDGTQYNITIGTDLGEFSGTVRCREEDLAHKSDYFGWTLAEIKAEIEYAKAKKTFYATQLKALTEFWRNMSATRTYDPNAFWVKKMREKVDDIDKQRNFWIEQVKYLKRSYYNTIKTRDMGIQTLKRFTKEESKND